MRSSISRKASSSSPSSRSRGEKPSSQYLGTEDFFGEAPALELYRDQNFRMVRFFERWWSILIKLVPVTCRRFPAMERIGGDHGDE